jgi:multiple sugar transport system ATP-binding protein
MVIENREFVTIARAVWLWQTTTLRMIAGLETPTSGKIIIGDRVVFDSDKGINISASNRDIRFFSFKLCSLAA